MPHYELKTDPEVFQASYDGVKCFEIRFNDRNYRPGDTLKLKETEFNSDEMKRGKPLNYTGREIDISINYILHGPIYGLLDGWVIMSVELNKDK